MVGFETPGMRKKRQEIQESLARPMTIQRVLVKAKMAGYGTFDGTKTAPAEILGPGDGAARSVCTLVEDRGKVIVTVKKPGVKTKNVKIATVEECQEFIRSLNS